jgi:D-alanyl-lipoteichoic acid acyltransferase DltB (MBOAT superfamily)
MSPASPVQNCNLSRVIITYFSSTMTVGPIDSANSMLYHVRSTQHTEDRIPPLTVKLNLTVIRSSRRPKTAANTIPSCCS